MTTVKYATKCDVVRADGPFAGLACQARSPEYGDAFPSCEYCHGNVCPEHQEQADDPVICATCAEIYQ